MLVESCVERCHDVSWVFLIRSQDKVALEFLWSDGCSGYLWPKPCICTLVLTFSPLLVWLDCCRLCCRTKWQLDLWHPQKFISERLLGGVTTGILPKHDLKKHSQRYARFSTFPSWLTRFLLVIQYCIPTMRDLPNMGEKERGKPDITLTSTLVRGLQPERSSTMSPRDGSTPAEEITRLPTGPPPAPVPGWMTAWRHFIYEKWRLCAFIALAVMVSRISSRA